MLNSHARNLLIQSNVETMKKYPLGVSVVIYDADSTNLSAKKMPKFATVGGYKLNCFDELVLMLIVATRVEDAPGIEYLHPKNEMYFIEIVS